MMVFESELSGSGAGKKCRWRSGVDTAVVASEPGPIVGLRGDFVSGSKVETAASPAPDALALGPDAQSVFRCCPGAK